MIVLIGFMGAGKSTVGRRLSRRLEIPFIDSDALIGKRLGHSISSIFEEEGEAYFRQVEHTTVRELLEGPEAVVALGGGAVQDARTRTLLGQVTVVHLSVEYDEALTRVRHDERRPMLRRARLNELYEERASVYRELATITVATDGRRPDAVVTDVMAQLGPRSG